FEFLDRIEAGQFRLCSSLGVITGRLRAVGLGLLDRALRQLARLAGLFRRRLIRLLFGEVVRGQWGLGHGCSFSRRIAVRGDARQAALRVEPSPASLRALRAM